MSKLDNQKRRKPQSKNNELPVIYGKLPPQAPDLEGAVLGAAMLEPQCLEELAEIIQNPEVFYSDANSRIYSVLLDMYQRGSRIDFMTVCDELRKRNELEMVGGSCYVTSLTRDVVSSAHVEEHARILMQKFISREIIRFSGDTLGEAYEDATDCFDLMDKVGDFALQLSDQVIRKNYVQVGRSVSAVLEDTLRLMNSDYRLTGVPTGFRELNRVTGGWKKTDLIILAARPAVGKTAYLLNLAMNAALDEEKPTAVGIFSLEMSVGQLTQRMLANYADVPLSRIKNGELSQEEFGMLTQKAQTVARLPIYIDDTATLNTIELKAKARRMKRVHNVGLIIIDYLQLMKGDSNQGGNREQEISKISRELKILAKTLEVPIIALSQLNRSVEGRADQAPKLSDLRDSGAIEQDADMVLFLYGHPKEYLKRFPYKAHERNLSIAKHRDGKLADFIYDFAGDVQRFHREELSVLDVSYEETKNSTFTQPAAISSAPAAIPEATTPGGIQDELPF